MSKAFCSSDIKFLSTLSLRRATVCQLLLNRLFVYFYPRSPYGERRAGLSSCFGRIIFLSTLSLRRATLHCTTYLNCSLFLSTLSLRRATRAGLNIRQIQKIISIHALLTESDSRLFVWIAKRALISIHALLTESDNDVF